MKNSVSDDKLGADPISCTLQNVQRMGVATTYWSIDEDGEPLDYLGSTDSDFYEVQYYCSECSEYFNSFEEVKEHFNADS